MEVLMAQVDQLLIFDGKAPTKESVATVTSSAAISVGKGKKIAFSAINASLAAAQFHFRGGISTIGAAVATDFGYPPGGPYALQLDREQTHVRFYNPTAGTVDFYVAILANS